MYSAPPAARGGRERNTTAPLHHPLAGRRKPGTAGRAHGLRGGGGRTRPPEPRPVFTYSDPASTLRITQERPYRLVSVSQNKPSADGSQIKLIYFSEEGKLTHPLSAPAGQDLAPGSAQLSYRLALIEAKLDRIEDSLGGK